MIVFPPKHFRSFLDLATRWDSESHFCEVPVAGTGFSSTINEVVKENQLDTLGSLFGF